MAVAPEAFLEDVARAVRRDAPHLGRLFEVYAQEARFGRAWLAPSLQHLPPGAALLEVGAGAALLSCQLAKEGYAVSALEPVGEGFSALVELQKLVLACAAAQGIAPRVLPIAVEQLQADSAFDFAYSINVMEHVADVEAALRGVARALRPGAEYRFLCVNYLFPYEPHFDIPTLFSKRLTEKVFRRRIYGNTRVGDAAGVWNSLNWITVPRVARAARTLPGVSARFDRSVLAGALQRAVDDREFSARRSPFVRGLSRVAVGLRLHRLVRWIPASMQPLMDCSITRAARGRG